MTTRAQYRAFRALILADLLRLGQSFGAGELSRDQYQQQHANLSLLLRETNEMELQEHFRSAETRLAA